MNNVEYQRKVMIEYALKLVQLALANNYILYYKDTECRNIVWDCQCSLMEWNNYKLAPQAKIDFFSKDELAYSYAYQLLNIAHAAVSVNEIGFEHISSNDLEKINLI